MTVLILHFLSFGFYFSSGLLINEDVFAKQNFVFWPNATVPFYINSSHFDREQSLSIMTSLSMFAFKTCIKFAPVMAGPRGSEHVLVFENPGAIWKCTWGVDASSIDEPHIIVAGSAPRYQAQFNSSCRKKMAGYAQEFKLYENVFIETNILSADYDGVIVILYPEEMNVPLPRQITSLVNNIATLDKHIHKVPTVWNCDYVSGGRLILSPTGKITPYHDAKVIKEAARKGMARALDAGVKKPLLVVENVVDFPDGQLVCILGALEALYVPLQIRERKKSTDVIRIAFHSEDKRTEAFEKIVRNAIALERSRIFTRDIAGGDPERMAPENIVQFVKNSFAGVSNITINVISDEKIIAENYPLLAAVSRAASTVERHKARVVEIEYNSSDPNRVTETLLLVGKGVTYDTGGADIKISCKMTGMSRDKSGAAAVAGFLKACSILKPPHLKVIGVLCLCRNSIGEESYVTDELLVSKSGKTVRVANTDAEGRLAMADSVFKMGQIAEKELNPHIYTIATLTGHAKACYGNYTAAMDNHSAKATNHATKLQFSGARMAEGFEVSTVRAIDLAVNNGKCKGDDLVQLDMDAKGRNHQLAAGFLIKVGDLEDKNIKYTHLDIAGSAGMPPEEPTAEPILSLCHVHKVLLY